ncbi:phospholipase D-like domain-containing protein [Gaoshiqia sp. Z1-71]|uniref:phospholipase D-like domain-containing protein n=1 Tax=Gaoshiqia hydrogeniformans TaxID=3290090 RepID=UPI003BF7F5CD
MDQIIRYFKLHFGQIYSTENGSEVAALINRLSREERDELRSKLFHEARILQRESNNGQVFSWLEFCFGLIEKYTFRFHKVYFSPGTDILEIISDLLDQAKTSLDLCVFTITDSRLAEHILNAARRGVFIRIITDDRKTFDHGSAILNLNRAGISVKIDHSQYHMHHKFGIIDKRIAFTGSFNWTYTASKHNQENLLVTSKYDITQQYLEEFEQLWKEMFSL